MSKFSQAIIMHINVLYIILNILILFLEGKKIFYITLRRNICKTFTKFKNRNSLGTGNYILLV